jgi:hypothetical protein
MVMRAQSSSSDGEGHGQAGPPLHDSDAPVPLHDGDTTVELSGPSVDIAGDDKWAVRQRAMQRTRSMWQNMLQATARAANYVTNVTR